VNFSPDHLQPLMANAIFLLVYVLFILERFPKVVVALLGASGVILLGIITQAEAFQHVDFNVIFLLVGMMIMVNILKQTGLFDWLAIVTTRRVNGSGVGLLLTFCVMTAICSAFLDNVTTILFVATMTCALAEKININSVPFLISEVIASNIGGTATLIGDPPNILIASAAKLSFNDFLVHVSPVILLILPVALATLALIYRKELKLSPEAQLTMSQLPLEGVITDKKLLKTALIVLSLVLLGFVFHHTLHQEVGTIALAGAAVLMLFEDPKDIWDDVEWDTIFFFIGLFIIVGAVETVGTLDYLSDQLFLMTEGNFNAITMSLLWVSGIASALIDNIPYTATMIPLLEKLSTHYADITPFWWALSLGACLGGNGTLIGATANVVAADIAAYKCGKRIRFLEFTGVGSLIMLESLLISTVYIWFRYLQP
jgi:Na+/H+ antiporter NhaD/arsenite permease-like protein